MRITVLMVPECPNTLLVLERLIAALTVRPTEVQLVEIRDEEQAAARGMTGSPTILLDGVDLFPTGAAPSLSCR
ncbi:MAG TPA: hypothetical protein VJX10_11200, partial [Pseudonocardiaceae bacterium]|nr:hypothetical protein [Pseudonocardiaceae bacterium]